METTTNKMPVPAKVVALADELRSMAEDLEVDIRLNPEEYGDPEDELPVCADTLIHYRENQILDLLDSYGLELVGYSSRMILRERGGDCVYKIAITKFDQSLIEAAMWLRAQGTEVQKYLVPTLGYDFGVSIQKYIQSPSPAYRDVRRIVNQLADFGIADAGYQYFVVGGLPQFFDYGISTDICSFDDDEDLTAFKDIVEKHWGEVSLI